MSIAIAVKCSDGVVMGGDGISEAQCLDHSGNPMRTACSFAEKLELIDGRVIVAGVGDYSLIQRFGYVVRRLWRKKGFLQDEYYCGKKLSHDAIEDFRETELAEFLFSGYAAFPLNNDVHLVQYNLHGIQPLWIKKPKIWTTCGAAQPITDPFMAYMDRILFKRKVPTMEQALLAVAWSLKLSIESLPGNVGWPIQLATCTTKQARLLDDDEINQYLSRVEGKEELMAS